MAVLLAFFLSCCHSRIMIVNPVHTRLRMQTYPTSCLHWYKGHTSNCHFPWTCTYCLNILLWTVGICDCHFATAVLIIVSLFATGFSRAHSNGIDAGRIAISCTGVIVLATITRCPNPDRAKSISTLLKRCNAIISTFYFSKKATALYICSIEQFLSFSYYNQFYQIKYLVTSDLNRII